MTAPYGETIEDKLEKIWNLIIKRNNEFATKHVTLKEHISLFFYACLKEFSQIPTNVTRSENTEKTIIYDGFFKISAILEFLNSKLGVNNYLKTSISYALTEKRIKEIYSEIIAKCETDNELKQIFIQKDNKRSVVENFVLENNYKQLSEKQISEIYEKIIHRKLIVVHGAEFTKQQKLDMIYDYMKHVSDKTDEIVVLITKYTTLSEEHVEEIYWKIVVEKINNKQLTDDMMKINVFFLEDTIGKITSGKTLFTSNPAMKNCILTHESVSMNKFDDVYRRVFEQKSYYESVVTNMELFKLTEDFINSAISIFETMKFKTGQDEILVKLREMKLTTDTLNKCYDNGSQTNIDLVYTITKGNESFSSLFGKIDLTGVVDQIILFKNNLGKCVETEKINSLLEKCDNVKKASISENIESALDMVINSSDETFWKKMCLTFFKPLIPTDTEWKNNGICKVDDYRELFEYILVELMDDRKISSEKSGKMQIDIPCFILFKIINYKCSLYDGMIKLPTSNLAGCRVKFEFSEMKLVGCETRKQVFLLELLKIFNNIGRVEENKEWSILFHNYETITDGRMLIVTRYVLPVSQDNLTKSEYAVHRLNLYFYDMQLKNQWNIVKDETRNYSNVYSKSHLNTDIYAKDL